MISPLIESIDSDGSALAVRATDGSVICSAFGHVDPWRPDSVNLQIVTQHGSAHFLATPEEARAIAVMIARMADACLAQMEAA